MILNIRASFICAFLIGMLATFRVAAVFADTNATVQSNPHATTLATVTGVHLNSRQQSALLKDSRVTGIQQSLFVPGPVGVLSANDQLVSSLPNIRLPYNVAASIDPGFVIYPPKDDYDPGILLPAPLKRPIAKDNTWRVYPITFSTPYNVVNAMCGLSSLSTNDLHRA